MKCPRCGADNADRAETCYLCEYPFAAGAAAVEPPAPDEAAQAQYPPPGAQAVPPPPIAGPGGYQPPPPGMYVEGYVPPPPAPKGPATVKIVIGVLIAGLLAIITVGAFFLFRGKTYSIEAPQPPGYEVADQELLDEMDEAMEASQEDIEVDALFVDASISNFVIVAHQNVPVSFGSDTPSGDDPEEMEAWFYEHEDEWVDAFNAGIMAGAGVPSGIDLYQVERLATGDAVLHMATSIDVMDTSFKVETLWVIKGRTAFFIMVEGLSPRSDTIEFLKENITFKG